MKVILLMFKLDYFSYIKIFFLHVNIFWIWLNSVSEEYLKEIFFEQYALYFSAISSVPSTTEHKELDQVHCSHVSLLICSSLLEKKMKVWSRSGIFRSEISTYLILLCHCKQWGTRSLLYQGVGMCQVISCSFPQYVAPSRNP